jgi:hypothetical protein
LETATTAKTDAQTALDTATDLITTRQTQFDDENGQIQALQDELKHKKAT